MPCTPEVSKRSSALPNGAASQLKMRNNSLMRSGLAFFSAVVSRNPPLRKCADLPPSCAAKGLIGSALKGGFWRSPCCHILVHWFPHKHHCSTHLPGAQQS